MKYYPIHTHYLPAGLQTVQLVGAVICVELNPKLQRLYYGWQEQYVGILSFLTRWRDLSNESRLFPFRPYFALEGETGFNNVRDLSKMRDLGLISIQLQRERKSTPFFHLESGLTKRGKNLLYEMANLDIFLDLSHLSGPILKHILENTPGPRIVSHVVCRDLFPWSLTTRANSMSMEDLLGCSAHLYGVPFIDDLVSPKAFVSQGERRAEIRHVAEHLVRLSEIVGPERVALGPDYFNYASMNTSGIEIGLVKDLDRKEGLLQLRNELRNLGLSTADIQGIFWNNSAKVLPLVKEKFD